MQAIPRELLHIYGPFSIQSYGVAIATGLAIFLILAVRHPWRKKLLSQEAFFESIMFGIITGVIGGRLLYVAQNWPEFTHVTDILRIWDGGFSILGTILAILLCMPLYLKKKHIPILPYFDLAALYAPLLQAISRLGCLCAGCCHGIRCTHAWCVTYSDPNSLAPLGIAIHPTQLYSSLALFCIFLFLYFYLQKQVRKAGQILGWYLILAGAERFLVDFWRADREFFPFDTTQLFSSHQYISLGLMLAGLVMLAMLRKAPGFYTPRS